MLLIPLSTIITFSWLAAKRMAQEGTDMDGSRWRNMASSRSGTFARVPPFTGSMTMTGLPWLVATW